MKFINSLFVILSLYSVYANVSPRGWFNKECDAEIEEYSECIFIMNDVKEHCDIISSEKCQKFFKDYKTVAPSCQDNYDLLNNYKEASEILCITDKDNNLCPFTTVVSDNSLDMADEEIISKTCQSEKCTKAYISFINYSEKISKQLEFDDEDEIKKLSNVREILNSDECTTKWKLSNNDKDSDPNSDPNSNAGSSDPNSNTGSSNPNSNTGSSDPNSNSNPDSGAGSSDQNNDNPSGAEKIVTKFVSSIILSLLLVIIFL